MHLEEEKGRLGLTLKKTRERNTELENEIQKLLNEMDEMAKNLKNSANVDEQVEKFNSDHLNFHQNLVIRFLFCLTDEIYNKGK